MTQDQAQIEALSQFHPACRNWFRARFGEPTPAQAQAWPAIKAGRHTLISAPTGSGKTLAAFYGAIDELLQKGLRNQLEDGVHVLYVSPLKALSNDIHKNLDMPLALLSNCTCWGCHRWISELGCEQATHPLMSGRRWRKTHPIFW